MTPWEIYWINQADMVVLFEFGVGFLLFVIGVTIFARSCENYVSPAKFKHSMFLVTVFVFCAIVCFAIAALTPNSTTLQRMYNATRTVEKN